MQAEYTYIAYSCWYTITLCVYDEVESSTDYKLWNDFYGW